MKFNLLITEPDNFSQKAKTILKEFCEVKDLISLGGDLENVIQNYEILFVRLGHKLDKTLLAKANKLKYIVSPTTGLDHIDIKLTDQLGIKVLSLKGETEFLDKISSTAELTWGLIIGLLRNIPWAFDDVKNGNWERDSFRGHDLNFKKLGIIGVGRLGMKVAQYGVAFGMDVFGYDPYSQSWSEKIKRVQSLEELLEVSDVVSVHVPLNDETVNLIDNNQFKIMKKGVWVINTSRGKIINQDALLENLKSGHLAGAALDVMEDEIQGNGTMISNKLVQYSKKNQNLLLSPHLGGAAFEAMELTEIFMAEKLKNLVYPNNRNLLQKLYNDNSNLS